MKAFVSLVLLAAITGCATPPPSKEVAAKLDLLVKTMPRCNSAKECEVKWSAARAWVVSNAGMKLQQVQPDYLETFNSTGMELAVRVSKTPQRDGSYLIEVQMSCKNWIACERPLLDAEIDFNRAVNASFK